MVLTISTSGGPRAVAKETGKAYLARLTKALKNLDAGRGRSLTESELDTIVLERLKA